ncbi:hypothetical protein [Hymenobacter siberiensis]|jgi:hypothetical protein|uniref:hypothetical protein n=1 Tax=Hymenobacter siberiensis TaxID=2848396 RepID=UPI001C1E7A9C|nr:hypothetical protein [Hymenobacter siberiensis]
MKLTCTSCGRGRVFFGDTCTLCGARNRNNTQSMDQFWGKGNARRESSSGGGSFFSPGWAIPFKLLWLPVRLVWWLVKIPF